jgi:hypothetical protein
MPANAAGAGSGKPAGKLASFFSLRVLYPLHPQQNPGVKKPPDCRGLPLPVGVFSTVTKDAPVAESCQDRLICIGGSDGTR